jgi:hypothetical protein
VLSLNNAICAGTLAIADLAVNGFAHCGLVTLFAIVVIAFASLEARLDCLQHSILENFRPEERWDSRWARN